MKSKKTILTLFATLGLLALIIAGCSNPSATLPAEKTGAETLSSEISPTPEIPTPDSTLAPISTAELPDNDPDESGELDPAPQSEVDAFRVQRAASPPMKSQTCSSCVRRRSLPMMCM